MLRRLRRMPGFRLILQDWCCRELEDLRRLERFSLSVVLGDEELKETEQRVSILEMGLKILL